MEFPFTYIKRDPLTGHETAHTIVIEADDYEEAVELAVEEYYKDEPV
jgi:hypothetical protein